MLHTPAGPVHVLPAHAAEREPTALLQAADIRHRHRGLLRELWIEVRDGGAVLHGHAVSYYGKQMALHEARRIGITVVANRIVVDH
jgi:hypothetical protein